MKYTTLTLPIVLLGCSAATPMPAPEPVPCPQERTLQDEANSVYVKLSGDKTRNILSYGDFSHGFWYDTENSFDWTGLRFDLFKRDEFERGNLRSLRFKDKVPLGTLDEVLICEDMYEDTSITNKKHCHPLLHTEGNILEETYKALITITYQSDQNKRDPALGLQLMNAYDTIMQNEGY